MSEHDCKRVQVGLLHKCVIYIWKPCNGQITSRFVSELHTFQRAWRYVFFTLLNIHYKTRNDQITHTTRRHAAPISLCKHTIHVNNNLRDIYMPAVALRSAFVAVCLFSRQRGYVHAA